MTLIPLRGGMTSIIQPRFDAARFLTLLAEHRVNLSYAVPSMIRLMLEVPDVPEGGFDSFRLLMYGTAPMPPASIQGLVKRFPSTMLINLYGLTEGGAAVCSLPPNEALKRPSSIGKPLPPTRVRIVDEQGADLGPDEDGEILMKTSGLPPRHYFKNEAANTETWTEDGWLRTGDIGRLDSDGYLYLVDRKKDLIIRGGFNIAAGEVEAVLMQHPSVLEAALIGVPHEVLGEDLLAVVVTRPGEQLDSDALRAFCAEQLADYKVPRRYETCDALPRNDLGKVLKRQLREGLS